jgi:hypothetical protein
LSGVAALSQERADEKERVHIERIALLEKEHRGEHLSSQCLLPFVAGSTPNCGAAFVFSLCIAGAAGGTAVAAPSGVLIESKQAVRPRFERWSHAAVRSHDQQGTATAEADGAASHRTHRHSQPAASQRLPHGAKIPAAGTADIPATGPLQSRALASNRSLRASVPAGYAASSVVSGNTAKLGGLRAVVVPV